MSTASEDVFDPIERAVDALADGQLVIVTDDEGRENEGDLVLAASKVTTERINFMIRHARGLICVPMLDQRLKRLGIDDMVPSNRESFRTAFTVSVDAAHGVTTGISAYDRALTVRALASPDSTPSDLVQPGHIFPLRARPGGVLERAGHTEASIDLVTMAGLEPCAVICEILNEDGSMARLDELARFKQAHNLPMISVAQLIKRRHKH
ncbi:MAG: 3,4-dihydroxy-2-butanone-4-phosphate synthase, partial [Verrucomicrobiota bacterium]